MYDPRYPSTPPLGLPATTPSVPVVVVFDAILNKSVTLSLVDGNYSVANFPARFSYVIPNPYGADNPLPPTGLPLTSTLLAFELSVILDHVLNVQATVPQIDAIFAVRKFPSRYSYVSGAPIL